MDLNFETVGVKFNGKGKPELIATPKRICADMANLFDYTDCNKKIWADIYCKTGNTLEAIINQGVNKNNVVAICDNKQSQMLICRKLYGKLLPEIEVEITTESLEAFSITRRGQVYHIDNWTKILKYNYRNAYNIIKYVVMKEMEKTMSLEFTQEDNFQINNIIMNPPYNNDMYIDFVELAHKIASENVVAITPAKWQTKGGEKNEAFRKEIVPYMYNIVYYPEAKDVFDIISQGGISYFLLDNKIHKTKKLTTYCNKVKDLETDGTESFKIEDILYNSTVRSIANKLKDGKQLKCTNNCNKQYTVGITNVYSEKELSDTRGKANVTIKPYIQYNSTYKKNADTSFLESFDTEEEANSYISYMECKIIRFGFLIGKVSQHMQSVYAWRFIPDPGKFNHIFTDEELYQKYSLTEEEIAIIESVIKERK